MYKRNCPKCNVEMISKNEKSFKAAIRNNSLCNRCRAKVGHENNKISTKKYVHNCPQCNKEIYYSREHNYELAKKNNQTCRSCSGKNSLKKEKKYIRNCPQCNVEIYYISEQGKNYADKHGKLCSKCTNILLSKNQKTQDKKRITLSGKGNPMYGKSTYDVWVQKYGKEEADKRQLQMINKCRIASSGENNPMYGKPSPKGSGNGWSGNYKGHYFRSLLELNYLIYLIDNDIKFENGELKKHHIQYQIDGVNRNYLPDYYLIDEDITIEIKPKNLINSYENKLKFQAAKNKLGNKHVILTEDDIPKIDINKLNKLYNDKIVIFDKRYCKKVENYLKNYLHSL